MNGVATPASISEMSCTNGVYACTYEDDQDLTGNIVCNPGVYSMESILINIRLVPMYGVKIRPLVHISMNIFRAS